VRRTIVIGDVHGCLDELLALLVRCGHTPADRVILVGDLVNKGPDSAGVVAWARQHGAEAVLGNHDDHALDAYHGDLDVKPTHRAVASSLSPADLDWLEARPLWIHIDDYREPYVVIHGGMVPGVPLEEQQREHLLNLRSIADGGRPSKKIEGHPWASLWRGPAHAVFGHDAVRGLQKYKHATGLDTGCVYGRALTALILPTGELVSEPARRAYAPMK
jgi:hypothetical protein